MANVQTLGTTNQAGTGKQTLSPQQRAILFAQATRQNYQTMPTQAVNAVKIRLFNLICRKYGYYLEFYYTWKQPQP
jgi:hypothetical protein